MTSGWWPVAGGYCSRAPYTVRGVRGSSEAGDGRRRPRCAQRSSPDTVVRDCTSTLR